LAHYAVYEFHPVVSKLQIYCSEDLGSFYLDILKDRLYTTAPGSLARRSAQTALWHITQAMLRWMAPFLSFTAEEAWAVLGAAGKTPVATRESIFMDTYLELPTPDVALLTKWSRIRAVREAVNKEIEALRATGQIGASLQVDVTLTVPSELHALLSSLGGDLKFVFITSSVILRVNDHLTESKNGELARVSLVDGVPIDAAPRPSTSTKCERCWHYCVDVGSVAAHPTICGRCVSNLSGAGEVRSFA
jgi:isoleucyl-tRNA synthetase